MTSTPADETARTWAETPRPSRHDRAREEACADDLLPPAAHLIAEWDALPEDDPWKRGLAAVQERTSADTHTTDRTTP